MKSYPIDGSLKENKPFPKKNDKYYFTRDDIGFKRFEILRINDKTCEAKIKSLDGSNKTVTISYKLIHKYAVKENNMLEKPLNVFVFSVFYFIILFMLGYFSNEFFDIFVSNLGVIGTNVVLIVFAVNVTQIYFYFVKKIGE